MLLDSFVDIVGVILKRSLNVIVFFVMKRKNVNVVKINLIVVCILKIIILEESEEFKVSLWNYGAGIISYIMLFILVFV